MNEFITLFFQNLGIQIDTLEVKDSGDDLFISLKSSDSHLLIGMHGKNLEAFSHILERMIEKKREKFTHVHLEVNDYIKNKEERLYAFLDTKIQGVMIAGGLMRVPNLTSYERKKAHDYIAEKKIEGLSSQSEGQGVERILCIHFSGKIQKASEDGRIEEKGDEKDGMKITEDGIGI